MKRMPYLRLAVAAFAGLYLQSCALDEYFESRVEQYTKAFIKEFGLVDPEQDWTMGRNVNAEVNVGATAGSVKIYGKYGETYYKVADLNNVGGQLSVPVHVPKTCTEMMVKVDGRSYYGTFGTSLNCTGVSGRGIATNDDTTTDYSKNPPIYTTDVGAYTIEVSYTSSGNSGTNNEYQLFNSQQMGPLVSAGPWANYYSLNTGEMNYNTNKETGLLPESGKFNRTKKDLDEVLDGSQIAVDFSVEAGENGMFTLFPYYYGTNLVHKLGVYLLNDDGTPKMNGSEYVKLPIFIDKDNGDMQVQPHYCSEIKGIKVFKQDETEATWDNPILMNVGDTYQLDVRIYSDEGCTQQIPYDEAFMKKYHSRIAYHAWFDEERNSDLTPKYPDKFRKRFVSCDENGLLTAHYDTHKDYALDQNGNPYKDKEDIGKYYMNVGIANGLSNMAISGVECGVTIIVTDPNLEPEPEPEITYSVTIPEGVKTTAGETTSSIVVCIDNNNIKEFTGIADAWGGDFTGVSSDNYLHCLYERDDKGVKDTQSGNVCYATLVDGKIELLYKDIKKSLDDHQYAIVDQYDDQHDPKTSYSYDDYELVGLKYNGGHKWWSQCFLYLKKRDTEPASIKSRADIPADYREMLTETDEYGGWVDVHRSWSRYLPYGKEVASYPVDQPMLVRTRGYNVKITNSDGSPYTGKFGMYIEMSEQYAPDATSSSTLSPTYTLYTQRNLNKYGQRTAAAFKHPRSGRTFFTFEDMDLTHRAPDDDVNYGWDKSAGRTYDRWEDSSDRDVNDLIFLIKGYKEIDGDKKITEDVKVVEDGFNWIWALEDLGSTGDFDFNDVVMRISDITVTKTTENAGGVEGNTTTEIARELRFKPLAAGGTLPVHIHLKYGDKDYTLAPGTYDITKGEAPGGMEWHRWFGSVPSTMMINTGVTAHITTTDKNMCVLIVDKDMTIYDLLTVGDGKKNENLLYVVVQGEGDETWHVMQSVDPDRMSSEDAYMIPLPEKGKAAQSFFILDNGGGTWQWMKEYMHICTGYPKFADWIGNPDIDWTSDKDLEVIYKGK